MLEVIAVLGGAIVAMAAMVFLPACSFVSLFLWYSLSNPELQKLMYVAGHYDANSAVTGLGTLTLALTVLLVIGAAILDGMRLLTDRWNVFRD